jgi:type II secretion system protein H
VKFSARHIGRHVARGMTLMEIMTVITILAVMMALTFPTMRNFNEKNKLRGAAREIVALMKYARTEAVFGERTTEIFLNLEKRQYWLDLREVDPKTGTLNPKRKKKQLEMLRELHKDIYFDEVTTYDSNIVKDQLIAIDFFPDGTASPIMLTLANKKGSRMTIELLKSTGLSEISAGTIEDRKAKALEEQQNNPAVPGRSY